MLDDTIFIDANLFYLFISQQKINNKGFIYY